MELPELYEIVKTKTDWAGYREDKGIEELVKELIEEVNKQGEVIEYLLSLNQK